jgi:primosomal protein N' (replication factor Y)
MLSKGHDYHNVDNAIILGIDSVLSQSDFRAREKAMSLLVQIAGRAGRKNHANIVIQTYNEEFFSKYLNDFEKFLKDELESRKYLYPPFKRFTRLIFSESTKQKSELKMNQALKILKTTGVEIVGHGEAAIAKIGGKYRFDILLRSESAKELLSAIYTLDTREFISDIDPITFT